MLKKKHLITALLAAVMTVSTILASCAGDPDDPGKTSGGTGSGGAQSGSATETEKLYVDNLGEYDFNDSDFVMLIWSDKKPQFLVDDVGDDAYSEAVYKRNRMIEDRFGVKLSVVEIGNNDPGQWSNHIAGVVASGLGDYDAVFPDYWMGIETDGYYLNLHEYDDIFDFSQPYWSKSWNDNAELWGQLYSAVGALSMEFVLQTHVVFYDRNIFEGLGTTTEELYTMVEEREWTLDKLLNYSRQAWVDSDADGVASLNDTTVGAAIGTMQPLWGLFFSFGTQFASKNESGEWELDFYNDKFLSIYEQVQGVFTHPSLAVNAGHLMNEGRVLFSFSCLHEVVHGLAELDNWAIVPVPLLDENQEDYIAFNHGTYYESILTTADDPKMSAVILEALNAESYRSVRYAFLEINFKDRFARDDKMADMIDLVLDRVYYDFAFVNGTHLGYFINNVGDSIVNNVGAASWWASNEGSYKQKLKDFQDHFKKLQQGASGNQ